mmetsp:Transcript_7286/g.18051  ORF Transcript_7286/g.18051 Transcript_7286/m.18051 type:complete len:228 (+) Transcript_7286:28-711(+)
MLRPGAALCVKTWAPGRTARFLSSRLPALTPSVLDEQQRKVYQGILDDRAATGKKGGFPIQNDDGSLVGPWNAMVLSPEIGALAERMGSVCRHKNACPANVFEIGILVVGERWLSQFEWFAHERLALSAGVSPEGVAQIKTRTPPAEIQGLTPLELKGYTFATELHDTKRVSDATYRALHEEIGDCGIADLVFTMGFYHQISMVLNVFNVPLPPGVEHPFDEPPSRP